MTVQPTRDQLRALADKATPGPWEAEAANGGVFHVAVHPHPEGSVALDAEQADAEFIAAARTAVPALLDALAAAEHRATRAEAQSDIRGRAVVMYRERAREAEAERNEWKALALQERGAALDALEQIKARDARIKAVRDVLDAADDRGPIGLAFDGTPFPAFVSSADIRRALDT